MSLVTAAPLAFIAGLFVGLMLSSRYRIIRRPWPKDYSALEKPPENGAQK